MQQPHQLHPHPPPYPHLFHLQQQQQPPLVFLPHMPPHLVPSPFIGPYDSPPHPVAPPSDPELQKRIDKLVEYAAKNGPEFEAMIREKQQDNLDYSFLFGGEGHNYYWYKLWLSTHGPGGPFNPPFPSSSMPMTHPPNPMMNQSSLNAPPLGKCTNLLLHHRFMSNNNTINILSLLLVMDDRIMITLPGHSKVSLDLCLQMLRWR
ncbi:unnamed protein product [Camellia sinensis]